MHIIKLNIIKEDCLWNAMSISKCDIAIEMQMLQCTTLQLWPCIQAHKKNQYIGDRGDHLLRLLQ